MTKVENRNGGPIAQGRDPDCPLPQRDVMFQNQGERIDDAVAAGLPPERLAALGARPGMGELVEARLRLAAHARALGRTAL